MAQTIAAAAGFLIAVLWFDLMFDVQVLPHRRSAEVPRAVLDSISAYYHRVTRTASPMGRLVGVAMVVLLVALVGQAIRGDVAVWVSAISLAVALLAIGLAVLRVFGRARRFGARSDSSALQSGLAREIFRDHVVCITAMVVLLAVQVAGA